MSNPFNAPEITSSELAAKISNGELVLVTDPNDGSWRGLTIEYLITDTDTWSDKYTTKRGVKIHAEIIAARMAESQAAKERVHAEQAAELSRMRALGVVDELWTSNHYDLTHAPAVLVPLRVAGGTYESDDGWDRVAMHDHLIPGLLVEQTGDVAKVFVTDARFSRHPDLHRDGSAREFVSFNSTRVVRWEES